MGACHLSSQASLDHVFQIEGLITFDTEEIETPALHQTDGHNWAFNNFDMRGLEEGPRRP